MTPREYAIPAIPGTVQIGKDGKVYLPQAHTPRVLCYSVDWETGEAASEWLDFSDVFEKIFQIQPIADGYLVKGDLCGHATPSGELTPLYVLHADRRVTDTGIRVNTGDILVDDRDRILIAHSDDRDSFDLAVPGLREEEREAIQSGLSVWDREGNLLTWSRVIDFGMVEAMNIGEDGDIYATENGTWYRFDREMNLLRCRRAAQEEGFHADLLGVSQGSDLYLSERGMKWEDGCLMPGERRGVIDNKDEDWGVTGQFTLPEGRWRCRGDRLVCSADGGISFRRLLDDGIDRVFESHLGEAFDENRWKLHGAHLARILFDGFLSQRDGRMVCQFLSLEFRSSDGDRYLNLAQIPYETPSWTDIYDLRAAFDSVPRAMVEQAGEKRGFADAVPVGAIVSGIELVQSMEERLLAGGGRETVIQDTALVISFQGDQHSPIRITPMTGLSGLMEVSGVEKPVLAYLEYEYRFLPMDGDLASHLAHVKQTLSELGCCYRDVLYQFPPEYQNVIPWPVEKATAFTVDGINWWGKEHLGGMFDQLTVSGEVWSISIMEREGKPSPDDTCRRLSEALGWQVDPEWLVPIHTHTFGQYTSETGEGDTI